MQGGQEPAVVSHDEIIEYGTSLAWRSPMIELNMGSNVPLCCLEHWHRCGNIITLTQTKMSQFYVAYRGLPISLVMVYESIDMCHC